MQNIQIPKMKKKIKLFVNEFKEKLLNCEEETLNNVSSLDRKGKGTLKAFNSGYNNSTNCFGSDIIDQDSATSSPILLKSSQTKHMSKKYEDIGLSDKDGEDQYISRISQMELSRSINSDSKRKCIENTTHLMRKNENNNVIREISSKIHDPKSHSIQKARVQDRNLATNSVKNDDHMAMSITRADLEAHSAKMFSKGSSLTSLTSQSDSTYSSKNKRRLHVSSKYKLRQRNQSSRTLMTTPVRGTNNIPQFRKRVRSLNLAHEPNMISALMTFGAMIQQLEKNHILLTERILNEQSNILKDFVKTLKHNHRVREVNYI